MAECVIVGNGVKEKQLGIYPIGNDGRPIGDVIVPNGVTSLYRYIFYNNDNVTSVDLPDDLTTLSEYCFAEMDNLEHIELPQSVNIIPKYCFNNSSIGKLLIDCNSDTLIIKDYAFYNANLSGLQIANFEDIISIDVGSNAFCKTDINNETVNLLLEKINSIGTYAFSYCGNITKIETSILSNYIFYNCTNLENVTISGLKNGKTSIDSGAFNSCSNLKILTFNLSDDCNLTTIANSCFTGCKQLETIEFPSTLTKIDSYAFQNCNNLSNLTIHNDNKISLGQQSFSGCVSLTNTDVENLLNSASTIYTQVFSDCTGLTELNIPICWTQMFANCTNLIKVVINSQMSSGNAGVESFAGCTSLEHIEIMGNVVTIGNGFLRNCKALKTLSLPSAVADSTALTYSVASTSYFLYGCVALENIELGDNWNASIRFDVSNNITIDSMVSMFNALKDLTDGTAKTLTLGATNLAKLTDEQKAIATNKNWTLA